MGWFLSTCTLEPPSRLQCSRILRSLGVRALSLLLVEGQNLTSSLYSIANPIDVPVWNNMAAIKSNILRRWDTATIGVKICCIKFVQKVVQVQTPGLIADPRVCHTEGA